MIGPNEPHYDLGAFIVMILLLGYVFITIWRNRNKGD